MDPTALHDQATGNPTLRAWTYNTPMREPTVFISYSSADKSFVRSLVQRLTDAGVHVWLDESSLQIGDVIVSKLADIIARIDFVLAVVSANSCASGWFRKEVDLGITREIVEGHPIVLPIRIDDSDVPETLRDKVYGDFREATSFENELSKLIRRMRVVDGQQVPTDLVPITRANPALIMLMIDRSLAMASPFSPTSPLSRAEAVAAFANSFLSEIMSRCIMLRAGGPAVVDRFYVTSIAYGGQVGAVCSGLTEFPFPQPISVSALSSASSTDFILPSSGGDTPMCKAFRLAYELLNSWIIAGHEQSMPPVVINFTGSAATDGDPRIPAANVMRLKTAHGHVLLFNCCFSDLESTPVKFPSTGDNLSDANVRMMFDMSSVLAPRMRQALEEVGITTPRGARGLLCQTDARDILQFLTVGTRGAIQRA
jgi:hypothetical protein